MKPIKKSPYLLIIGCVLLLLLSQTAASLIVTGIQTIPLMQSGASFEEIDQAMLEKLAGSTPIILLVSYAIVLAVLLILAKRRKQKFSEFTGLHRPCKPALMVLAAVAGFAASVWLTIAISSLPLPDSVMSEYETQIGALTTSSPVLDFIATTLAGPVIEEILFRGIIYDSLCLMVPAGAAVVLQGLFFGAVHGSILWMIYAALMGCLFGYIRKHTGSLRPCIIMHIAFNGAAVVLDRVFASVGESAAGLLILFLGSAIVLLLTIYGINFRMREQNTGNR